MSYAIIKSIGLTSDSVYLTLASNNVSPRIFERWKAPTLTEILLKQGKEEVIKTILKEYWGGNFQAGTKNIYTRTLSKFSERFPEYNWQSVGHEYNYKTKKKEARKYTEEDLKEKLYDVFLEEKSRPKIKGDFVIKVGGAYILSTRKGGASTCFLKVHAKKFKHLKACEMVERFKNHNAEMIKI